jgi:cytochrome c oxidase assembly protein subunit 15
LLVAGALVTSNEAGDSVPDWPLSFGRWLIHSDYFVANVRYEYSHRFIAGVVGFATFLLALWAWRRERRGWVRRLALFTFAGVVAQALIGGIRVLFFEHKPFIAIPHALVAQSFFAAIIALAVFTSRGWFERQDTRPDRGGPPLRTLAIVTVAALLIQLVLGAGFRHGAFTLLPHALGAITVASLITWTALATMRRHRGDKFLVRPARLALALVVTQFALGVLAYWSRLSAVSYPLAGVGDFLGSTTEVYLTSIEPVQPVEPMISLTVAHVVVGALTLATMMVLALRCYRALASEGEREAGLGRRAVGATPGRAAV